MQRPTSTPLVRDVSLLLRPDPRRWAAPTYALPSCEIETPALPAHVVALHLRGSAPVRQVLNGRSLRRPLGPGAVTIIPAFTATSWTLDGPVEFLHLYLPPELLQMAADEVGTGAAPRLAAPFGADDPLLEQLLLALRRADEAADPLYTDALRRLVVLHLLRHHAGAARPPQPGPGRSPMTRVLDFIEGNIDRPLLLADLAAVAGVSVFHFARTFKDGVGTTPHRYVLERRVARAQALLAGTRLSLTEVAAACGFANSSHFATAFRRLAAVSPRAYRQRSA